MWRLETRPLAFDVIGAAVLAEEVRMTFSQVISAWRTDDRRNRTLRATSELRGKMEHERL